LELQTEKSRVLTSWKEIAAFLGVSERTAQNWERTRGLPVTRVGGGERPRIAAYTDQLARWQNQGVEKNPTGHRLVWISLGVAALLIALFALAFFRSEPLQPVSLEITGRTLRAIDQDGNVHWSKAFPSLNTDVYGLVERGQPNLERASLIMDVNHDGYSEVLFMVVPGAQDLRSSLVCLGREGTELWRFDYGREIEWNGRHFSDIYVPQAPLQKINAPNGPRILTAARHAPSFPMQVVTLDPQDGTVTGEFWHPGALVELIVTDLDGDGRSELLMGGTNSPGLGNGNPCLLSVPLPLEGRHFSPEDPFGFRSAPVADYILFPHPDLFLEELGYVFSILRENGGRTRVWVKLGSDQGVLLGYEFGPHLEVISARPNDAMVFRHEWLRREGQLDHTLTEAEIESWKQVVRFEGRIPNANSDEVRNLFPPALR